jgi:hypothetical protein
MMKKILFSLSLIVLLVSIAPAQRRKTSRSRTTKPKVVYIASAPKVVYVTVPAAPVESPIVEKAFAVGANSFSGHPVYVADVKRLLGRFEATGGGRNDIRVLIVDADGLTNFKNGNQFSTYFDSGNVTVGNFDVKLAGDKWYYIIFKNYYWFGGKAVTLKLQEFGN